MEEEIKEVEDNRTERVIPIAQKFIKLLAEEETLLGDIKQQDLNKAYLPITDKMVAYLIEENVTIADIDFAFRLAMQAFDTLSITTNNTINRMFAKVLEDKMGKKQEDLKMEDISYIMNE